MVKYWYIKKEDEDNISKFSELTFGCSGGPMMIRHPDLGIDVVVGVNSHLRGPENSTTIDLDVMYSPNFGDDLMEVLEMVAEVEDETGVDFF